MSSPTLGVVLHAFFEDHLKIQKGLSSATIKSYRDGLQLFLKFLAAKRRCQLTRIKLEDLTFDRVQEFLVTLETERHNHTRSRNQRLTALRVFFDYIASRSPEMWSQAERVALIPSKRVSPPRTFYLERDDVEEMFERMRSDHPLCLRDRTLLLFLYNTGARVQEVADLRRNNLELEHGRVHLHGKGDKWRSCPLWNQSVILLKQLLGNQDDSSPEAPVFLSQRGQALTRFGIYKIVRRHTSYVNERKKAPDQPAISPHTFRHTAAAHLLEAGVDVNVIRAWLGHNSLETTNRYAEINIAMKEKALQACDLTPKSEIGRTKVIWRDDPALLKWLQSL